MDIEKIKALLEEASTADPKRANQIQCELSQASAAYDAERQGYMIHTPAAGVDALISALFVKLYQESPELLPSMLPVFAIACGPRPDNCYIGY